jgi:Fuc2NAc and GlcNAc transferase
MDGIDGLAATQAIFMLLAASALSGYQHPDIVQNTLWLWMLYLVAASGGFLIINWSPAKLFMGDVGSTFLAFMLVFFALISLYLNWLNYAVWGILAALFISDASVTLVRRILTKQAWTEAHRSHAYQRLSRQWQSHQKVTLFYLLINIVWLLPLAYLALQQPQQQSIYLTMAYIPILLMMYKLKAGKREICVEK